ncbi:uncharacterized protein LOC144905583 [Branchiostoma floridae x Branchiostoma belcheri]
MDLATDCVSPTLLSLLSKLSTKLDHTLPAALIGNIVTNAISGSFTTLQIALGVFLNRKGLIEQFHEFLASCSYDEVLRFKASAAAAAVSNASLRGHVHAENSLVQLVSDNFDAQISSQNGLLSTHSLAMLLTFVDKHGKDDGKGQTFRRIRKDEMKEQTIEDIPVQRYYGPKKPNMPSSEVNRSVLPLKVLAHQVVALERARHLDFEFFKCVATSTNPVEFGGFNTKLCREQGQSVKPATKAVYLPLIDMNPAHPDSMLTAMTEAQRLTKECGQGITILTNDQQLYKVAVNVKWVYQERFSDFIPRLGGMHMLMSFIGCVGVLMADSGLEDIMKSCFGGVAHMLSGKKFPQNFRALRMHSCSMIVQDIADMSDDSGEKEVTSHKEEKPSRITSDAKDRDKIRDKLLTCIDPLDPTGHPAGLINVVTGQIAPETVNAHDAVDIGNDQLVSFEKSWPGGFNASLSKLVVTMAAKRKSVKVGNSKVYDTNLIYSRVLGLQQSRDIDIKSVLAHELSPVPTSMFDDEGNMRIATTKSTLKKKLQVTVSQRLVEKPEVEILDGCALLWVIHWPNQGTVADFVNAFTKNVMERVANQDTYLIFDRYFSIKSGTRAARAGEQGSRRHKLQLHTPLPPQKVVLAVPVNKVQIIDLICQNLIQRAQNEPNEHSLVITTTDPVPVVIQDDIVFRREDLLTCHEEADVIIVQQMVKAAESGARRINIVCEDTDVFVLLLHYYAQLNLTCRLTMEGPSAERTTIDIGATASEHGHLLSQLPAAHALSGCDTVAQCFGVGKSTVIKVLTSGVELHKLGVLSEDMGDIIEEATAFMAACYGVKSVVGSHECCRFFNMSEVRGEVWRRRMGSKTVTKAPDLRSLPPSTEAFEENVRRAHIQTAIWKYATSYEPPALDPVQFGWERDERSRCLVPVTVQPDVTVAPPEVLEMVRCGCATEAPCSTSMCGCYTAHLSCTIFCGCHGQAHCQNHHTRRVDGLFDD